jgi:hypothetical protein
MSVDTARAWDKEQADAQQKARRDSYGYTIQQYKKDIALRNYNKIFKG